MYCEPVMLELECHARQNTERGGNREVSLTISTLLTSTLLPPPLSHARAERPHTHTTLPTVYHRPTDRPNPPCPTRAANDHTQREMSTERGGIGTVFRAPMKQKWNASKGRAQKEEDQIVLRVYTHTLPPIYTILY